MKVTTTHILFLSFIICIAFLSFDPLGLVDYVFKFTGTNIKRSFIIIPLSALIAWVIHKIFKKKYDEYE